MAAARAATLPSSSSSSRQQASAAAAAASTSQPQQQPASSSSSSGGVEKCDKCDGKHATDKCPWFKKAREKHPDAKPLAEKKMLGGMPNGPVEILRQSAARVVRQPGDGSCLFHSLSYGLKDGSTANALRKQVCEFIAGNPTLMVADSPLKDWVQWDSGSSVSAYARRMSTGGCWGGGIEMCATSHLKGVDVYVYQAGAGGYKRISSFPAPGRSGGSGSARVVRVLYGGGVHYDALELTS